MTTLEIVLIVFFAIVVLTIFFLYLFNSIRIKNKLKKEQQRLEQEKKEQEEAEKQKAQAEQTINEKKVETPKDVVTVQVKNETFGEETKSVAITEQTAKSPESNSMENMSREEFEEKMTSLDEKVEQKTQSKPNLRQQIDQLSPELKSVLFSDILKPKY